MRVYDWASDVKDAWFIEDSIHLTSPGYAARAELIAQALAHAFHAKWEREGAADRLVSRARVSCFRLRVADLLPPPEGRRTMADLNERDAKLVQYLNEAYGKEKELETALQAHIAMTTRAPYKKRLQQHLRETKGHARQLERRIKQLGGGGHVVQTLVGKTMAAAKGPLHMVRGSGEQEKMLKNAKTEYFNEHEEISTYLAIETFAERVGDAETANSPAAFAARRNGWRNSWRVGSRRCRARSSARRCRRPNGGRRERAGRANERAGRANARPPRKNGRNSRAKSKARKPKAKRSKPKASSAETESAESEPQKSGAETLRSSSGPWARRGARAGSRARPAACPLRSRGCARARR